MIDLEPLPAPRPHPLAEEFFEHLRRTRRERRASPSSPPKRRALLTIAQNESVFLPIWLGYYSRYFAPQDIYVLDHQSTDGSTDRDGFVRVPVEHDSLDFSWMVSTIETHQRRLLERYDVVLVGDVDEIVTPLPEWGSLGEYLDHFDEDFVNPFGYEILHMRDREAPFRGDRPILDQRGFWFQNDAYNKPVLATEPLSWAPGFHTRADGEWNLEPDLRLVHLHRMDYEICLARHRERSSRNWNPDDLAAGLGAHNRISEEEEFERWFYEDSSVRSEGLEIVLEPIPETWRGLF